MSRELIVYYFFKTYVLGELLEIIIWLRAKIWKEEFYTLDIWANDN